MYSAHNFLRLLRDCALTVPFHRLRPKLWKGELQMFIDFWHGETKKDVARIDCFFYASDCTYRGNMYNKDNRIVGDFATKNSVEVENTFKDLFQWVD